MHLTNKPIGRINKGKTKEASHAAKILGKIKTKKKAKSSRENGKLGGRPKKNKT